MEDVGVRCDEGGSRRLPSLGPSGDRSARRRRQHPLGAVETPTNRTSMPDANYDSWITLEQIAEAVHFLALPGAVTDGFGARTPCDLIASLCETSTSRVNGALWSLTQRTLDLRRHATDRAAVGGPYPPLSRPLRKVHRPPLIVPTTERFSDGWSGSASNRVKSAWYPGRIWPDLSWRPMARAAPTV